MAQSNDAVDTLISKLVTKFPALQPDLIRVYSASARSRPMKAEAYSVIEKVIQVYL